MGIIILVIVLLMVGIGFVYAMGFTHGFSRGQREHPSYVQQAKPRLLGRLLVVLGGAALLGALGVTLYTWHFIRVAQRTDGAVIEMREQVDKDSGSIRYAPTFQFQDATGSPHTVSSSLYSSPPEFQVGDRVPVLYRQDNPQSARIASYWQVWGGSTLLGIGGGLELMVGFGILFWPKMISRFRGRAPSI